MSYPLRLALRFLTVVAVIMLISVAFSPGSGRSSPYVSALSDLSAGPAWAAPSCPHTECAGPDACVHGGHTKCTFIFGNCATRAC